MTSTNRRNLTVCTFTGMQITQLQCDHTVQQASRARRSQASELCTKGVNENGSAGLCDGERPAAVRRNVLSKCVSLQRHAVPVRNNKEEKERRCERHDYNMMRVLAGQLPLNISSASE